MDTNINEQLEKIWEELHSLDKIMLRNTIALEEHIKRTNLLEKRQEQLDSALDEAIAPMQVMSYIGRVSMWLVSISGAMVIIYKLIEFLQGR